MGGGMPGMGGGMGGGMPGMGANNPFSKEKLEALKTNPKIAPYFQDPQFKNMFEMCMQNPQMLMQVIQMDPRFMHVFEELTGINLNQMGAEMKKKEEADEASKKKAEDERK